LLVDDYAIEPAVALSNADFYQFSTRMEQPGKTREPSLKIFAKMPTEFSVKDEALKINRRHADRLGPQATNLNPVSPKSAYWLTVR
jgi:hypothetical protein